MASSEPLIPHFFARKSIFITGATGFMGKVLLYRLLTACPDIRCIYLLMRTKNKVPLEQRLQQLINSQIFDELRQNCPSQLDKLVMIPGDVTQPQLGIASDNLISLNEVSIVFHSAATVKFNEELRKAVDQNVRSAISLMDICDRLPHLEALIHVSTAYSNFERDSIEEVVYESPVHLDQVLALVDSAPPHLLAEITDKYIYPKPNTYTFTKAIAENYVDKHVNRRYSVAIFRPTIVICSQLYPVPGWIENLNGPSGVIVGSGKGYLHVFPFKKDVRADMIPVDIVIDTMIAVAWETAVERSQKVRVYNCSNYENPTNWAHFRSVTLKALRSEVPLDRIIWYPFLTGTVNKYAETTLELLWQRIPMHLAEYGARIFGIKTRFSPIMVAQRLRAMSEVLRGFATKEFHFETSNVRNLRQRLSPADAKIFNLDVGTINWDEQIVNFVKGTRRYLLGEKDQDLEKARRKVNRMWYLHTAVSTIPLLFFLRFILRNPVIKGTFFKALRLMMFLLHAGYLRVTTPKYMN